MENDQLNLPAERPCSPCLKHRSSGSLSSSQAEEQPEGMLQESSSREQLREQLLDLFQELDELLELTSPRISDFWYEQWKTVWQMEQYELGAWGSHSQLQELWEICLQAGLFDRYMPTFRRQQTILKILLDRHPSWSNVDISNASGFLENAEGERLDEEIVAATTLVTYLAMSLDWPSALSLQVLAHLKGELVSFFGGRDILQQRLLRHPQVTAVGPQG